MLLPCNRQQIDYLRLYDGKVFLIIRGWYLEKLKVHRGRVRLRHFVNYVNISAWFVPYYKTSAMQFGPCDCYLVNVQNESNYSIFKSLMY